MSRTFRNRRNVPKGYVVRDGGDVFYTKCCNYKQEKWTGEKGRHRYNWGAHVPECPKAIWSTMPKFRRSIYRCERKPYRKLCYQKYRAKCHAAMKQGRWDSIPNYHKTSGWLTW